MARKSDKVVLYANPFGNCKGFTFDSVEQLEERAAKLAKRGCEEYEVEFHDGSKADAELFRWVSERGKGGTAWLELYFDKIVGLNEHDKATLFILLSHGIKLDLEEALKTVDDEARSFEGTNEDYAHELIDDIGVENITSPEAYFDYEAFGRDAKMDLDADDENDAHYFDMSDEEYGEQLVDDMGFDSLGKDLVSRYFDYEKFARDLDLGGDTIEFEFGGKTWVLTNPNL